MKSPCILVVDDEEDIREIICLSLEVVGSPKLFTAASGNEAIKILQEQSEINLVVSDLKMSDGTGLDLFHFMVAEEHPAKFVLISTDPNLSMFTGENFLEYIPKPNFVDPLVSLVKRYYEKSSLQEFVPIPISVLRKMGFIAHDIYIRLGADKFLKVYHAETDFEGIDESRFADKNVQELYLRTEDAMSFINEYKNTVMTVLESKSKTDEEVISMSKRTHELIYSISSNMGWSEELKAITEENIKLAQKTVENNPDLKKLLNKVLQDQEGYLSSHSMAITHIACGLSESLKWNSKFSAFKISLAAMLHDLTLKKSEIEKLVELNKKTLIPEEREDKYVKRYMTHPDEASKLVKNFDKNLPDVAAIIQQHHERPDGTGFPTGVNFTRLNPMVSLFIFTEHLVDFLFENPNLEVKDFINQYIDLYDCGNFKKILELLILEFELDS